MRVRIGLLLVLFFALPAFAQDAIYVGSGEAAPGSTIEIPITIADQGGTPLGVDAGAGNQIQGIAVSIAYSPAAAVAKAKIVRAGIATGLEPMLETNVPKAGTISYVGAFDASSSLLPFTQPPAEKGDEVLRLQITLARDASGTVTLTPVAATTMLSNVAGTVSEDAHAGNLLLGSGAVAVQAARKPLEPQPE